MTTTTARTWMEVPAVSGTTGDARLKYPIGGNALVIYRGGRAYVRSDDRSIRDELLHNRDVRLLSPTEMRAFEHELPLQALGALPLPDTAVRLGDVVHSITTRLGITSCAGCRRRRRLLNNVVIWGWWRRARHFEQT